MDLRTNEWKERRVAEQHKQMHISTRVHLPFITWTIALVPSALVGAQE